MSAWVAVDLDGTLAVYSKWQGIEHIGNPLVPVVFWVKQLLDAGVDVRIFTARAQEGPEAIAHVREWTRKHLGKPLPVTATKDMGMVLLIDDRAINPFISPRDMKDWDPLKTMLPPVDGVLQLVGKHWTGPMAPPKELDRG